MIAKVLQLNSNNLMRPTLDLAQGCLADISQNRVMGLSIISQFFSGNFMIQSLLSNPAAFQDFIDTISQACGWNGIQETDCILRGCCWNQNLKICSNPLRSNLQQEQVQKALKEEL